MICFVEGKKLSPGPNVFMTLNSSFNASKSKELMSKED
jgi:hypothetical protein